MTPVQVPLRRKDRAVTDEPWMVALLQRAPVGTLSISAQAQPFLHINLFAYQPDSYRLYFHSARQGKFFEAVLADPRACFGVYEMGRLLPAETAMEFSVEFSSLLAFGKVQLVNEPEEAGRGLQMLLDKYFPHLQPGQDYRPANLQETTHTAVYRMEIDAWSGKRKSAPADAPGAFWWATSPDLG